MLPISNDLAMYSVGAMSEKLQASPFLIERLLDTLGIEASLSLNDRPYFSAASVELLDQALQTRRSGKACWGEMPAPENYTPYPPGGA